MLYVNSYQSNKLKYPTKDLTSNDQLVLRGCGVRATTTYLCLVYW